MSNNSKILSDEEFVRKYAKEQYERYPEIIENDIKLNNRIDKMMMNRQNTINLEAKKQDKPCISGSSCLRNDN
jgi:hypothetical protein